MPRFTDRKFAGRYMEDDIWLSRQTIKGILRDDLAEIEGYEHEPERILAVKKYINLLMDRFGNLKI